MGKVSLPQLQKQLAYREVSHHCLQARKPPNGKRISRAAEGGVGWSGGLGRHLGRLKHWNRRPHFTPNKLNVWSGRKSKVWTREYPALSIARNITSTGVWCLNIAVKLKPPFGL